MSRNTHFKHPFAKIYTIFKSALKISGSLKIIFWCNKKNKGINITLITNIFWLTKVWEIGIHFTFLSVMKVNALIWKRYSSRKIKTLITLWLLFALCNKKQKIKVRLIMMLTLMPRITWFYSIWTYRLQTKWIIQEKLVELILLNFVFLWSFFQSDLYVI